MRIRDSAFKVVAISKNTNSFGLYGLIIMNKQGISYQLGVNKSNLPKTGDTLTCKLNETNRLIVVNCLSYEIPESLPTAPQNVIDQIWPLPTAKEQTEFDVLKKELFVDALFVVPDETGTNKKKWERYNELIVKIQNKKAPC